MNEMEEVLYHQGFQKYIRIPLVDFPLIIPPRQHILPHVTAGLSRLYDIVSEDKKENESTGKSSNINENGGNAKGDKKKLPLNGSEETKKRDDEGGGLFLDDEEPTPYTNENGVFLPDNSINLLAARYKYVEMIAHGQSATIIKALDTFSKDKPVAIKVLHQEYKPIGSQEADILLELHRADPWLHVPFARLQNQFIYGPHYCLVFDFFCPTEQKCIKDTLSLPNVRNLCVKLLSVLGFLHKQNVIHADLKPENILLEKEESDSSVMVIDFGNALRNTEEELSVYYSDYELQTLLYRAPEVIFGLKLGLEIDMWSLGCLLAECYTSEPLFMGQTKEDILNKMTEMLGPLPQEFSKGNYSEEFAEYIGKPLTRFQRVENLRRKLNNCQDIQFLFLLEQLLTYTPSKRLSPFEAACHPFVAATSPFLYLTPSQERKSYPIVLLDSSTYPYLPNIPEESDLDEASIEATKRLRGFSASSQKVNGLVEEGKKDKDNVNKECSPPSKSSSLNEPAVSVEVKSRFASNSSDKSPEPSPKNSNKAPKSPPAGKVPLPEDEKSPIDHQGSRSPIFNNSVSIEEENSDVDSIPPSKDDDSFSSREEEEESVSISRIPMREGKPADENISRKDVKQTLKSMGLRCEDFTISVYSKEETHAILRKQGVEVTNHVPPRKPQPRLPMRSPRLTPPVRPPMKYPRPSLNTNPFPRSMLGSGLVRPMPNRPRQISQPRPAVQSAKSNADDEDDDCVILDPPEAAPPRLPIRDSRPPKMPPRARFPQQFQLMGTTVQVNRGSKRPLRPMPYGPMAKRHQMSRPFYSQKEFPSQDSNSEASVQDTLKRLKNYNISITCRKNAAKPPKGYYPMDSDSEMDMYGEGGDSEDEEEDMARFLECKIHEEDRMESDDEYFDLDSSVSICDSPIKERRNKVDIRKKPPVEDVRLNSTVELEPDGNESNKENDSEEETFNTKEKISQHVAKPLPTELDVDETNDENSQPDGNIPPDHSEIIDEEKSHSDVDADPESPTVDQSVAVKETPNDEQNDIKDPVESPKHAPTSLQLQERHEENKSDDDNEETTEPTDENIDKSPNNDEAPEEQVEQDKQLSNETETPPDEPIEKDDEEALSKEIEDEKLVGDSQKEEEKEEDCDNLDDDINEELEKQLLEAANLDDDDYEGEDMDGLDLAADV